MLQIQKYISKRGKLLETQKHDLNFAWPWWFWLVSKSNWYLRYVAIVWPIRRELLLTDVHHWCDVINHCSPQDYIICYPAVAHWGKLPVIDWESHGFAHMGSSDAREVSLCILVVGYVGITWLWTDGYWSVSNIGLWVCPHVVCVGVNTCVQLTCRLSFML